MRLLALLLVIQINCGLAAANEEFAIPALPTDTPIVKSTIVGRSFYNPPDIDTFIPLQKAMDQMRSNRDLAPELLQEMLLRANELPPVAKFYISALSFEANPEKAVEWYWLGTFQARLDMALCADQEAAKKTGFVLALLSSGPAQKYIKENPGKAGEIGRRVLARPDLMASMASPAWVCDMASKRTKRRTKQEDVFGLPDGTTHWPNWLRPEAEAAKAYGDILTSFRAQIDTLSPPPNSISEAPLSALPVRELWRGRVVWDAKWLAPGDILAVINDDTKKPNKLVRWQRDGAMELVHERNGSMANMCISDNGISLAYERIRSVREGDEYTKLGSAIGLLTDWQAGTQHESTIKAPTGIHSATLANRKFYYSPYFQKILWRQSRFDCKWRSFEAKAQPFDSFADWTDLGDWPGFLATYDFQKKTKRGTFYFKDAEATPVKIWDDELPLDCARYIAFRGAVLLNACKTIYVDELGRVTDKRLKNQQALYWLVRSGDSLSIQKEPFSLVPGEHNRGETQAVPTKAGLVRLVPILRSNSGFKLGGLFLYKPDGDIIRIWKGYGRTGEISPDGCKLLVEGEALAAKGSRRKSEEVLLEVDVCSVAVAS